MKKYPSPHLLQLFEAAARTSSFKLAAEELFITPSAVSHQIKTLEETLGMQLFQRKSRGVELNTAGRFYLSFIQKGLASFESGTTQLKAKFSHPTLKVTTFSTLATHIIIPQLGQFQTAHPDIDLRIETSGELIDLRYEDYDLAIRIGEGDWPELIAKKLCDIYVSPVCSPKLLKNQKNIDFEILNQLPLINISSLENVWGRFATELNLTSMVDSHYLSFDRYDDAITAAEEGLGIALAVFPIEQKTVDTGRLVKPFDINLKYDSDLYAVFKSENHEKNEIECFLSWLTKSPYLTLKV